MALSHPLLHVGFSLVALLLALSAVPGRPQDLTLQLLRDALVRQEDTIVFALIERAKYPSNIAAYRHRSRRSASIGSGSGVSFMEVVLKESEAVQAKAGRYRNPEEIPFFADYSPLQFVPPHKFPQELHHAAAKVNVSKTILEIYVNKLLPLISMTGDDGNYASAASSDLVCLQALSRRIHYGRFVAEVKFRDAPNDYIPAIRNKDKDTLMKLLTSEKVEAEVVKRVEKKAAIFGQTVTLDDHQNSTEYKVDPPVASRLYKEWVIPLTKVIEVEYLLRRLD